MASLLSELVPTAIAGAISPLPILIAVTLLGSKGGLAKALAFGLALTGVFAAAGAVVLATASTNAGSSDQGSAITGTIIAVLGGVLVLLALKQLFGAPDPDAGPPRLMAKLNDMSAGRAAVLGAIIAVVNFKQIAIYLAGVSQIANADVSAGQGWLALVILLVVIQSGVIVLIAVDGLAGERAARILESFRGWLLRNSRAISIAVGLVVGAAFVVKGVTEIAG